MPELPADLFALLADDIPPLPEEPEFAWTEEQEEALAQVDAWFDGDEPFFALTGPAGTGKSTIAREIVRRHDYCTLTAMTGKAALRLSQVTRQPTSTLHSKLYWPPKAGADLRFERLRDPPSAFVAVDECFDYGQRILTETGWQEIGKVVNSKIQTRVWARNPVTGQLELKPIVRWLKKSTDKALLHINASRTNSKRDGRSIKCTPEHKVLTPTGYVRAGDLRVGDAVVVRGRGLTTTVAAVRSVGLMKQRHQKLPPVYDIEVADFHNYVAGNIVVSNCSMMGPAVFRHLGQWGGARCLLIGDGFQLPAVIVGKEAKEYGDDWSVFTGLPGVRLDTVMRSVGGVLRAATRVRQTGEIERRSDLDAPCDGYEFASERFPLERAVEEYLADRDDHLLITWRNAVRMAANKLIREKLGHEGPLPDDGEPVLLKRNGQGRLNGEIVICGGFESGPMLGSMQTLWMSIPGEERMLVSFEGGPKDKGGEMMDGQAPWIADWKAYHIDLTKKCLPEPVPITWARCLTCHSAQGGQARRTTVFLAKGDDRSTHFRKPTTLPWGETAPFSARFLYTAQTRSTKYTKMIVG